MSRLLTLSKVAYASTGDAVAIVAAVDGGCGLSAGGAVGAGINDGSAPSAAGVGAASGESCLLISPLASAANVGCTQAGADTAASKMSGSRSMVRTTFVILSSQIIGDSRQ
jgi:hypothetical protein